MIKLENISKKFGGQKLFDNLSFAVNKGEKIGLVGRNGYGKTTLFNMIIGEVQSDKGEIKIPKNYTIGYLKQHLDFSCATVLEEALTDCEAADTKDWKAKKILTGLGFSEADFEKSPVSFSGGYQIRINLAKVLLSDCDLLMLDEPNNYLDIVAIRWLEDFLKSWKAEIILITHDRSFMDAVVTHTVCIHRNKTKKIKGNTSKLYAQIEQEEKIYEKTRLNEEKKRKQTEEFITKFRAKARLGGMVQSRIKTLEKNQSKERLDRIDKLGFNFNYFNFNASQMLSASELSFGYKKDLQLIKDFSINIDKRDKIAVIGKNGKGKSTLLKLLAGELKQDSGTIKIHDNVVKSYFGQTNIETLNPEKTILDELLVADPDCMLQNARSVAGNLMFSGDLALKKIKVLSGGERSRVMLGKILLTPSNMLFLDEPTNHLDMDSCEALLDAVINFKGAVLMVTHNEEYLRRFAERLVVFDDNVLFIFDGTYDEFMEMRGWSTEVESKKVFVKNKNKKELRRQKAELLKQKQKLLKPIKDKIVKTEKIILELDEDIKKLNKDLIRASSNNDAESIKKVSLDLNEKKKMVDKKYEQLENLYKKLEELE